MKQTVIILTALMISLLLVSGFIVTGSVQQGKLLISREEQISLQQEELRLQGEKIRRMEKEAEEDGELIAQLTGQRDALSSQLGDAVLSSQEANDAVAQQVKERELLAAAMAELEAENSRLQRRLTEAEAAETPAPPQETPTPYRVERRIRGA